MGLVYADITMISGDDIVPARKHIIGEEEIRGMTINILVETSCV